MTLTSITLETGNVLTLTDQTSHYFGGYFHVKILISCDIPLVREYFASSDEFDAAVRLLGNRVKFERILEKMAVAEGEIDSVREQLIATFRSTALAYLASDEFAPGFIRSLLLKQKKQSTGYNGLVR